MKKITPEKIVEQQIRCWLIQNRFVVDVYDSRAVYSKKTQSYQKSQGLRVGTPDLIGCSPLGHFVALELKAENKQNVCRIEQYQFLEKMIQSNGFCLVVSDVVSLKNSWENWLKLKNENKDKEAKEYLLSLLPSKVIVKGKTISLLK